jgi:hypothetical protein
VSFAGRLVAIVGLLGASYVVALADPEIEIRLADDRRTFFAAGAADGDEFIVRVAGGVDLPEMAGRVDSLDGGLRFTPIFPLTPGVRYRASVGAVGTTFAIPEADQTPVAMLAAVYPSAEVLPENLLKFYLHFSEPMAIGEASEHVHLIGEGGGVVELPFLELAEELWDPDGRRLTLFFDPGRVKRGLKPHEEEGRPLQAGKSYELCVGAAWRDARGRPMVRGFSKKFRTVAADYVQPDAKKWRIEAPEPGSRQALRLTFMEALDHGLLERVLKVYDSNGQVMEGEIEVGKGEVEWRWKPAQPWEIGNYRVVVEALLEDLAGNSVARLFEEIGGVKETWNVRGGRFIRVPFVVR